MGTDRLLHQRPVDLPVSLSSFVGRERELAYVVALIERVNARLVTLTGPGGVGKTRLAVRAAGALASGFPGGVWFVPLADVPDPGLVAAAVSHRLGVRAAGGRDPVAQLVEALGERRALIVLDNVEHLLAAAPIVADLLAACPELRILATGREALHLSGEHVVAVPPLSLPDPITGSAGGGDAARLFVERAAAAGAALGPGDATTVAAICRRLDGLPLAIELAAARTVVFGTEGLLARLEPRLPLLTGGPRDAPARHQTMRDAVAWGYDLLAPGEQAVFRRLAVFAGGFTTDAAERLVGDEDELKLSPITQDASRSVSDWIASLVGKSLLRPDDGTGRARRYAMLETVREFALERLAAAGEEAAARDAHATWCLALAERAGPELSGPDQGAWVVRLEAELGNIRAAHAWLRQRGRTEAGMRLALALTWFWSMPGRFREGRDLVEGLLGMPGADADPSLYAAALDHAADLANWLDDYGRAAELFRRVEAVRRALDDRVGLAITLRGIGSVRVMQRDAAGATAALVECLEHARATGQAWYVAGAEHLLGIIAFGDGRWNAALAYQEAAFEGWMSLGDTAYAAGARTQLGLTLSVAGHAGAARAALREALALATACASRLETVRAVDASAQLDSRAHPERAAGLLAWVADAHAQLGTADRPPVADAFARCVAAVERALGGSFAAAWASGRRMSYEEAVALAQAIADAGGPEPKAPAARLTRREVEVLQLMATGLTDREIGERLCISRRTASNHVAGILATLGVASRREAARVAVRLSLLPTQK